MGGRVCVRGDECPLPICFMLFGANTLKRQTSSLHVSCSHHSGASCRGHRCLCAGSSGSDLVRLVGACQEEFEEELDVVSVIPTSPPADWDSDTSHLYRYRVTPRTGVTFLARVYRLVFCLDLSPSVATVVSASGPVADQGGIALHYGIRKYLLKDYLFAVLPFQSNVKENH